ncbi:MAG TPA: MFS transporter [Paracoccaceae bacterium]|nr:MFS transporter [Paracoccaceae bacterium]
MTVAARHEPAIGPAAGWTLAVLFLTNFLSVADRALLGVVTEPVRQELALSDTQMSLANGLLFVGFNLVAGVFIARMVDRGNRKRILIWGVAAWSLATALTGFATDFYTLSLARIAVGIGEATAFPVALSMIPDLYRAQRRAGAVAIFQISTYVGIIGGTIVAGIFAAVLGWRNMFVICGAAGIGVIALLILTVREPAREVLEGDDRPPLAFFADLLDGMRRILAQPGYIALATGFGFSTAVVSTLGAWGPAFFQRVHGVPLAEVGLVIGPPVGLGGIAGMMFAGLLANRLAKRRGRQSDMLFIPMIALPLAVPVVAAFLYSPSLVASTVAVGGMNFLLSCAWAPCLALALALAASTDRALASTLMLVASGLLGGGLGPLVVGLVSDFATSGQDAAGLRLGMSFMIVVPAISVILLIIAWRQADRVLASAR